MIARQVAVFMILVACRQEVFIHDLHAIEDGTAIIAFEERAGEMRIARLTLDGDSLWMSSLDAGDPKLASAGRILLVQRDASGGMLEARALETGVLRWLIDPFDGERMAYGRQLPLSGRSESEIVVTRNHQIVFLEGTSGRPLGRHRVVRSAQHVNRLESHVFVGEFELGVFERGRLSVATDASGPGCIVGEDYVFAKRAEHGLLLVRFAKGDPKRSTIVDLGIPRDTRIDACLARENHVILSGRDRGHTRFWRVDANGGVVGRLDVPGGLDVERVQEASEVHGLVGQTRYVPVPELAEAQHFLIDLDKLEVVAEARTDGLSELRRIGNHWFVIVTRPRLAIGRIDGDRGVFTAASMVLGTSLQSSRVHVGGDSLWLFSGGWHDGMAVTRLDAETLVGTMVGADMVVVPIAAFLGFPR